MREFQWENPSPEDVRRAALQIELDALNLAVEEAIQRRTLWMNTHMTDFAKWKVGDELFHLQTGKRVGVVSRLYRFHGPQDSGPESRPRDARFDTSMNVEYEVNEYANVFGNSSSCYGTLYWGTKEELLDKRKQEVARLEAIR